MDYTGLIPVSEIPDVLLRTLGRQLNRTTAWRWANSGRNGVVLDTCWIGRQLFTTPDALQDFLAKTERQEASQPCD